MQVSLDEDGEALVTASMLLADGGTCAGAQVVTVMLTPTGSPIPGSPEGKLQSCWQNTLWQGIQMVRKLLLVKACRGRQDQTSNKLSGRNHVFDLCKWKIHLYLQSSKLVGQ
ncbi:MAG: hypothetical protein IPJ39_21045 [Saprospiraceae bacterium]|nr:hypothetical protein [Saprospiraceae bacterium]